jgi:hypothetical protein
MADLNDRNIGEEWGTNMATGAGPTVTFFREGRHYPERPTFRPLAATDPPVHIPTRSDRRTDYVTALNEIDE